MAMSLWHALVLGPVSTLAPQPLLSILSYLQPNSNVRRSGRHAYSRSLGLNQPSVPGLLRSCIDYAPSELFSSGPAHSLIFIGMYGMVCCDSTVRLGEEEMGDRQGLIFESRECRSTLHSWRRGH
ncbi:hypothetical protein LZ32DRAFT_597750 [Colletotrichum eremochloae]|nr:hypothetical protein LZ32DRAFT_597750 [Colletotrichum eremochloae]